MESAHTPGPWLYRSQELDDRGYVRDARGYVVATARAGGDYDADTHRAAKTDPFEANARLIAAAPDLLAVCQPLALFGAIVGKSYIENNGPDVIRLEDGSVITGEAADALLAVVRGILELASLAQAAIAKAQGPQNPGESSREATQDDAGHRAQFSDEGR